MPGITPEVLACCDEILSQNAIPAYRQRHSGNGSFARNEHETEGHETRDSSPRRYDPARLHDLAGRNPAWVIVDHESSIDLGGASGDWRIDA